MRRNKITELFDIKYPIIQAGMVWCSGWRLASAVSNAGGLGLIGAGSMYPDVLREHIVKCKAATDHPFGVNVPLMYAFNAININAGHGPTLATILGFLVTIVLILILLYKKIGVDYTQTLKRLFTIVYVCFIMSLIIILLKQVIQIDVESRSMALLSVVIFSSVGAFIYIFITIKNGLLTDIFGQTYINRILKKFKFKKGSIQ